MKTLEVWRADPRDFALLPLSTYWCFAVVGAKQAEAYNLFRARLVRMENTEAVNYLMLFPVALV